MYNPIIRFENMIWVDINFLDIKKNMYMVSNYGIIKNKITNKILSNQISNGYLTVSLQTEYNLRKTYYIHRLVGFGFLQYNNIDDQINHIDYCRMNNYIDNLEWISQEENIKHEFKKPNDIINNNVKNNTTNWSNGYITKGECNGMSKFTDNQVHIICKSIENGLSYKEALECAKLPDTDNNRYNVSHIAQGKRWKHISSKYNIKSRNNYDYTKYVEDVCYLIHNNKSNKEICEILNLPGEKTKNYQFINRIRNRKSYINISKKYTW